MERIEEAGGGCFKPRLVLRGRLRVTFRWSHFMLDSDTENSAASIASRTVSVGARIRMLAALANLGLSATTLVDIFKESLSVR